MLKRIMTLKSYAYYSNSRFCMKKGEIKKLDFCGKFLSFWIYLSRIILIDITNNVTLLIMCQENLFNIDSAKKFWVIIFFVSPILMITIAQLYFVNTLLGPKFVHYICMSRHRCSGWKKKDLKNESKLWL